MFLGLQRLWRSVLPIRQQLTALGFGYDQSRLADSPRDLISGNALSITGIIYAIWSPFTTKMYVGQSIHSSMDRYQQHMTAALACDSGDDEPFHMAIRRLGCENFAVFPLEIIPSSCYDSAPPCRRGRPAAARSAAIIDDRVTAFRRVANGREQFWIDRLRTAAPYGFNAQYSSNEIALGPVVNLWRI